MNEKIFKLVISAKILIFSPKSFSFYAKYSELFVAFKPGKYTLLEMAKEFFTHST